jgi:peptide/nickel transport system substrate-binding protein
MLAAGGAVAQAPARLSEAPSLAARVAAGQLPAVGQRIGAAPMVVTPLESVGRYGGSLRTAMRGGADYNAILRIVGLQSLVRWNADMTGVLPNVAQSFEISPDATTYTFRLRPGMRWSDGTPFTADDVLFSMNDVTLNREYHPSIPERFISGGKPVQVERIDDHAVRFVFAQPNGRFLQELSIPQGQYPTMFQKAYCQKFHPAHTPPDKLAEEAKAKGLKDWTALFRQHCADTTIAARWANPERPTLDPWIVKEGYRGSATRVLLERNPYFWQVDTAGNQLPYIDQVIFPIISDIETIMLRTIGGELDLQFRHINTTANRPVLAENSKRAGLRIVDLADSYSNAGGLYLNMTHKNPKMRELFRNKDFRIALSHAINRREIGETVLLGAAEPFQIGPLPQHPWHNAQLGTQFTAHDPATSNALLDKIGFTQRDGSGIRLWPDGRKLTLLVDYGVNYPETADILALVKRDLAQVGVEVSINAVERSLFYDRAIKNDHEIQIAPISGGLDPDLEFRAVLAEHPRESRMSIEWQKWLLSRGRTGEEPPEDQKKRYALLEQWRATADPAKADAVMKELLQISADAFEVIGTVRPTALPGAAKANLKNLPAVMINGWAWPTPGPTLPQQYFFAP